MRFIRVSVSCRVMVSAWPQWSDPVTLGGGIEIEYGLPLAAESARK